MDDIHVHVLVKCKTRIIDCPSGDDSQGMATESATGINRSAVK